MELEGEELEDVGRTGAEADWEVVTDGWKVDEGWEVMLEEVVVVGGMTIVVEGVEVVLAWVAVAVER